MKDDGSARPYEDMSPDAHASDNEYLYYMHYRLGHANAELGRIKTLLVFILIAIFGILGVLMRMSGVWPFT